MELREACLVLFLLTSVPLLIIPSAEGGKCIVIERGVTKVNFSCSGGCCMNSYDGFHCCNGGEGVGFGMGRSSFKNQDVEKTTRKVMTMTSGGETVKHRPVCPIFILSLVSTLFLYLF